MRPTPTYKSRSASHFKSYASPLLHCRLADHSIASRHDGTRISSIISLKQRASLTNQTDLRNDLILRAIAEKTKLYKYDIIWKSIPIASKPASSSYECIPAGTAPEREQGGAHIRASIPGEAGGRMPIAAPRTRCGQMRKWEAINREVKEKWVQKRKNG